MFCRVQDVSTLLSIIGSDNSVAAATSLLKQNKGSVAAAVNAFYDPPDSKAGTKATNRTLGEAQAKHDVHPGKAATVDRSSTQSSPARAKAVKRSASGKHSGSPASKLAKQQKAITSFFKAGDDANSPIASPPPSRVGTPVKQEGAQQPGELPACDVRSTAIVIDVAEDARPSAVPIAADDASGPPPQHLPSASAAAKASQEADPCNEAVGLQQLGSDVDLGTATKSTAEKGTADTAGKNHSAVITAGGSAGEQGQAIAVTVAAAGADGSSQLLQLDKCGPTDHAIYTDPCANFGTSQCIESDEIAVYVLILFTRALLPQGKMQPSTPLLQVPACRTCMLEQGPCAIYAHSCDVCSSGQHHQAVAHR